MAYFKICFLILLVELRGSRKELRKQAPVSQKFADVKILSDDNSLDFFFV